MVEQFLNHIHRHNLCKTSDKILLAVSGGVDSMVMADLFVRAGFEPAIAHCNFLLRGKDSDGDESFVTAFAESNKLHLFKQQFRTAAIAEKEKRSIQETARNLRYRFFNELCDAHGFNFIATAHHFNDSVETILINLTRGTGIDGLKGIPVVNGRVIRPLLFASREMIEVYAKAQGIRWREDSSNLKDDYQRNFIRLRVIPLLKELNPNFEETFRDTVERQRESGVIVKHAIADFKNRGVRIEANQVVISMAELKSLPAPLLVLWETLKVYGFNYDQCVQILDTSAVGKYFEAGHHRLLVDRTSLLIQKKQNSQPTVIEIAQASGSYDNSASCLQLSQLSVSNLVLAKRNNVASLDLDKLTFPLVWRPWRDGDQFMPLGMSGMKKLSDFFVDAKVTRFAKERVTVIESAGKIVWVAGLRIDERFKITANTSKVLLIEIRENDR